MPGVEKRSSSSHAPAWERARICKLGVSPSKLKAAPSQLRARLLRFGRSITAPAFRSPGDTADDHGRGAPDSLECGGNSTPVPPGIRGARPGRRVDRGGRLACRRFRSGHTAGLNRGVAVRGKRRRRGATGPQSPGPRQPLVVTHATEVRSNRTALPAHSKRVRNP